MKMKTKLVGIIATIMGFIMLALFFLSVTPVIKSVEPKDSLIRTVQVEQITNGEQVVNLISKFDYYETSYDDTSIYFEGILPVKISNADNISSGNDTLDKKFKTRYNYTTNEFIVEVSLLDNGIVTESWEKVATPHYDEELDEGYLELDGERVYISECFDDTVIDNCVAGTIIAGAGCVAAVAAVIIIVATPPSTYQEIGYKIEQVVETVVEKIKSFWGWLKRWVKRIFTRTRTVVKETVTTVYAPSISINGVKCDTVAKTKAEIIALPRGEQYSETPIYYLAYASGLALDGETKDTSLESDGLFIGPQITYEQAVAIMTQPNYTEVERDNVKFRYVNSVYTYWQYDIINLMNEPTVGFNSDTPCNRPERHNGGLLHYHPMAKYFVNVPFIDKKKNKEYTKKYRPHAFFMEPNVTYIPGVS